MDLVIKTLGLGRKKGYRTFAWYPF